MKSILFIMSFCGIVFIGCFWVLRIRDLVQTWLKVPLIDPGRPTGVPTGTPLISLIVPAHNEEAVIAKCLDSVLRQDYPNLELICVDDRSGDETAALAEELFRGRDNCKLVSVRVLRQGWTGKCNALDVGVRYAQGEWLAFLDADSTLHPAALRQCHAEAVLRDVSMVTLSPKFIVKTFWEKALLPAFASISCLLFPLARVNDPRSPVASANGMFFLISRKAYQAIGGHHDVRNLAVEDIGIGKRVKAAGLGIVFANGRRVLETRMYTNFSETFHGWSRIISASMNYQIGTVLQFLATQFIVSGPMAALVILLFSPTAREIWPGAWFIPPALCVAFMLTIPCFFYRHLGVPTKYTALLGLGNVMVVVALGLIVKQIVCKDALQWRGTTYDTSRYQPRNLDPLATELFAPSPPAALKKAS